MSIVGTYKNINGVISNRRRRRLVRQGKPIEREVWVVEAEDAIANVGFTILFDARYSGEATATPQIGTRNISIVSSPVSSPMLTAAREEDLVSVDLEIAVEDGDYVVRNLQVRERAPKDLNSLRGRKPKGRGKPGGRKKD
jgi:hypothetical protein